MYNKLQFALHGLLAALCLPLLCLIDKIIRFVPDEPLQKKNLTGHVCVVTGEKSKKKKDLCEFDSLIRCYCDIHFL